MCFTGRILLLPIGCISLLPIGRIYRYWREQGYHPLAQPMGQGVTEVKGWQTAPRLKCVLHEQFVLFCVTDICKQTCEQVAGLKFARVCLQ